MAELLNSLISLNQLSSGSDLKSLEQNTKLLFGPRHMGNAQLCSSKRTLTVQARYNDDGRSSSGSAAFVGGFVLGGFIFGTFGFVIHLRTHRKLTEKIAQLNDAIDDISYLKIDEDEESNVNGAIVPEKSKSVA